MLNNKKCENHKLKKNFNELIISSTSLLMFKGNDEKLVRNIYKKARFPVFGADCYSYGLLLSGKIDLIVKKYNKFRISTSMLQICRSNFTETSFS